MSRLSPLLVLILLAASPVLASEAGPRANGDGDRTGALPEARQARETIARCGHEWTEIKRSGGGADLTWRRFWETCRRR